MRKAPHPARLVIPPRVQLSRRPLSTERVVIEPLSTGMHRKLYRAVEDSRSFLAPWLPWVPFNDSQEASFRYTEACEADWQTGTALRFALRLRHESPLIGVITLENISDLHRNCDLGYWLRPSHTGRGLMTEAAARVVEYGFERLKMHRIRCAAAEDNLRSQRVIERLGFFREGIAREAERVGGRWVTHIVYSRLETDGRQDDSEPSGD